MLGLSEHVALRNEFYAKMGATGDHLFAYEEYWREKQPFLTSRGYTLRPRYHPKWRPSWHGHPDMNPLDCEDFWQLPVGPINLLFVCPAPWLLQFYPTVIDARRVSDGKLVCIKRIRTESREGEIAALFSTEDMRRDPRNHCIPVLEILQDDEFPEISYLVMPFCRSMDNPPFNLVDDVLDFADQVLEVSDLTASFMSVT